MPRARFRSARAAQRVNVQRACQPDGRWDVVEGAARLELVEEPHALLAEGHREDDIRHLGGAWLSDGRCRPVKSSPGLVIAEVPARPCACLDSPDSSARAVDGAPADAAALASGP